MIAKRRCLPTLVALVGAGLLLVSCDDAGAGKKKRDKKKKQAKVEAPAPGSGNCKAPAPASAELASGLELYLAGDWRKAYKALETWAESEGSAEDPAAARGYYSLGYAYKATRQEAKSGRWFQASQPLLERSAKETPNLEDLYYLASLHRQLNQPAKQLEVVASALGLIESGAVCPATDGDDDFRVSRLLSFAGREEERKQRLESAAEKYAKGQGVVASYHALTLQELGEHARISGDAAKWESYLDQAAALDPSIPNVHRRLGLAMLQRGDVAGAAEYWRKNWRKESNDGNSLVYAVRVLQAHERLAEQLGEEHVIANIDDYTKEALEQNAIFEAKAMATAASKLRAEGLSDEETAKLRLEHDSANFRMAQLLTAYVAREQNLQEFALQNGLLPAIHGAGLPRR